MLSQHISCYTVGERNLYGQMKEIMGLLFSECFNFLKATGQHVESACLDYVWIEVGVLAPNTIETGLEGNAYYRPLMGAYASI